MRSVIRMSPSSAISSSDTQGSPPALIGRGSGLKRAGFAGKTSRSILFRTQERNDSLHLQPSGVQRSRNDARLKGNKFAGIHVAIPPVPTLPPGTELKVNVPKAMEELQKLYFIC